MNNVITIYCYNKFVGACLLISCTLWAQGAWSQNDPLYNQYQFNQLVINPAYAGVHNRMTATLITRLQWVGIEGAPLSNNASIHTAWGRTNMGVGLMVLNDRLGINENTEVNGIYSYRINFRRSRLQFGLQVGVVNFRYDYNKLTLEYLDDPNLQANNEQFTKPNFGSGIFYSGTNFFIGVSLPRMLNVKVNDGLLNSVRYRRHIYASGGIIWPLSELIKLKPSALLKIVDGKPISYDINMHALFAETLWVGVTYRDQNSMGINTQLEVSDRVRVGYGFEYPFEPLNSGNLGTHELMVSIDFTPFKRQVATRRYY